ncbi:MAG: glycoside hydrolase family protein [Acidobacteriaceae bacterium]|nr:glycoside hydrolase family protein [Acidobacteriaceae bacterium]MBV9778573.1 glycoside hydrolase family protein [Acidobacteriaceae bacterium]
MNDHFELKQLLIENEGNLCHMYLDTVGRVTVGVGHMIPNVHEAEKLSFVLHGCTTQATLDQIASDYAKVESQQRGMLAEHYRPFTALDMTPSAIDELLSLDIATMEAGVRAAFHGYDTYPAPAQDALLDMAFNLGVNGLVTKFPHLKAAAEAGDWQTCAAECRRNGISDARNEKTRTLFENAKSGRSMSLTA